MKTAAARRKKSRFALLKKSLLGIILLGAVIGGWFAISGPEREKLVQGVNQRIDELQYGRELRYGALNNLRQEDLEVRLPLERTNFWWRGHMASVMGQLSTHPLVQEASVTPCHWYSFRCFSVEVVERVPQYVVKVGGERWLLGDDGGFISSVPAGAPLPENGIFVGGLSDRDGAPDLIRAQLKSVKQTLPVVIREVGKEVSAVEFLSRNEIRLSFKEIPFRVTFDLAQPQVPVDEQARRLKVLLKNLNGRDIGSGDIDLSFNRMAVVSGTTP